MKCVIQYIMYNPNILGRRLIQTFNSAPADAPRSLISFLSFSRPSTPPSLYQSLVHWSRVASAFCCRLNRLVLDDRSKILTTSGERRDAQPGRERRRPDRSTGLHRVDAPLDKGEPWLTALVDQVRISPIAHTNISVCLQVCYDETVRRLRLPASLSHLLFSSHYFLNSVIMQIY